MLVTFHTPSHGDVIYLGKQGLKLLKLMGRTGDVPGALDADRVGEAIQKLKHGLDMEPDGTPPPAKGDKDAAEEVVALRTRALPLIELLESAQANQDYVSWD